MIMKTKSNELWRNGSFAEGDWAYYEVKKGTKYVTLYYQTRVQGSSDESWSWPANQAELLINALNEMGGEGAVHTMPTPAKHHMSKPVD
jgi:hypothetical protein